MIHRLHITEPLLLEFAGEAHIWMTS